MKKIGMLFLSLFIIVLVVGCGTTKEVKEQTLTCTTTEEDEDMSIEQVISMTYKNDKLKHMTMAVNTTLTNPSLIENWEDYKKFMDEDNKVFDKDGVSLNVVVDDQNYKYNTILDIDVENATYEALKEQGFEGIKNDNSTLEDSKKEAEKDGATCIVK